MAYTLNIDKLALTRFKKLPAPIQRLLVEKAHTLNTKPYAGALLKGKYRLLRSLHLRIKGTAYRIIYQVFERSETIVIRLAVSCTTLCRHLDPMKLKP
jgi:mRNA-degrading endonuclease RelE of RelBE toxin-antitoxin system